MFWEYGGGRGGSSENKKHKKDNYKEKEKKKHEKGKKRAGEAWAMGVLLGLLSCDVGWKGGG